MQGAPIEHAKEACREVIKNLRPEDYFSLVVFDSSAQVVIPLERPVNRFAWYQTIDQIQAGASTNLMAGWLLGRDELMKAQKTADGIAPIRKILLLTDGHLNAGITEPDRVEALTRAGLETDKNCSHHAKTLAHFENNPGAQERALNWLYSFPLWLDLGFTRIVHAAWSPAAIRFLKTPYLTPESLLPAGTEGGPEYRAVETLWRTKC
jgi:hypothetical protein